MPAPLPRLARQRSTASRALHLAGASVLAAALPAQAGAAEGQGGPFPPTLPEFEVTGTFSRQGDVVRAQDFEGTVGGMPVRGSLTVDLGGKPYVEGSLTSERLDWADLRALLAALPRAEGPPPDGGPFPETRLPGDVLGRADGRVELRVVRLVDAPVPVTSVRTQARLEDRRLGLKPLEVEAVGGRISGEAALNAREQPQSADLRVGFKGIELKRFAAGSDYEATTSGHLAGGVSVLGVGGTLDDLLATLQGDAWIAIEDGTLSARLVELVGVDVLEALVMEVKEDEPVAIRCGRADLVVDHGVVEIRRLLIDTADAVLVGGGRIDLGKEELDLSLEARAKDFSLIDAAAPVLIRGPLGQPEISVGPMKGLPLFEMGDQEPLDCAALLAPPEPGRR
jgi:uncharacterized protein involved in outer membrane biogenesis